MTEGSAEKVNMAFIAAIVAVATIGGFMFGYDSGVISGTRKGLESALALGKLGLGGNVGAMLVGASCGAFLAGRLADLIGRRWVVMPSRLPFPAKTRCGTRRGSGSRDVEV